MNRYPKDNRNVQEVVKNYELEIKMVREMEKTRMAPAKSLLSGGKKRRKLAEV